MQWHNWRAGDGEGLFAEREAAGRACPRRPAQVPQANAFLRYLRGRFSLPVHGKVLTLSVLCGIVHTGTLLQYISKGAFLETQGHREAHIQKGAAVINIDYQDRRPIYEQIVDRYQTLIVRGVLPPDTQMPSVRQTAVELKINPNTISKAYGILEREGFIYSVKGRGSFVSGNQTVREKKKQVWLEKLEDLLGEGLDLGVDGALAAACVERVFGQKRKEEQS